MTEGFKSSHIHFFNFFSAILFQPLSSGRVSLGFSPILLRNTEEKFKNFNPSPASPPYLNLTPTNYIQKKR